MLDKRKIEQLALERVKELDSEIFIVELSISSNNLIRVELDKMNGEVKVEECVSVSRNIEHNLDREKEDFELQVSSAGLHKPLRVLQQFKKNKGKEVKIQLEDNNKTLSGILLDANEKGIILKTTSKEKIEGRKKKEIVVRELAFDFEEIKTTKIVISFKK